MLDATQDGVQLDQKVFEYLGFMLTRQVSLRGLDPRSVSRVDSLELFGSKHLAGRTQQLVESRPEIHKGIIFAFEPRLLGLGDVSEEEQVLLVQVAEL